MVQPRKQYERFKHGSVWVRADFHLHTKADKEFQYDDDHNAFVGQYVAKLKVEGIAIGVITNHNKFDKDEFVSLRKRAKKEEILLLPGVELSVNDGANGVHVLVVFSDQWLENNNDYINSAINTMFPGKSKSEYEQENGRSDKNILQVVEELDKVGRDYFLIFAHVEQRSGLWNEMNGGKVGDFATKRYASTRERTLGFQKVRTRDEREKVKQWLGGWYPAEVEGSDSKNIEDIGSRSDQTWVKLGDFTFEAVKYALADFTHRLSCSEPNRTQRSWVKSIRFEGGILDRQVIRFSSELNSLIGIRGSGKSSLLEAIRYALNIPFSEKTADKAYKERLLVHTLGSGGKVIVEVTDKNNHDYTITRRLNDLPEVFVDEQLQPGVAIRETVIHKPIYFGQKDLSSTGEGFEKDLVEKLMGEGLKETRENIGFQKENVVDLVLRLSKLSDIAAKMVETREKKQDAVFRLKVFKENGIDQKLQQQTEFDVDQRRVEKVILDTREFESSLTQLLDQFDDDLKNHLLYKSKQNVEFFKRFFECYKSVLESFDDVRKRTILLQGILVQLVAKEEEFTQLKKTHLDTFAETRRQLEAELKKKGKSLNLEEFPELQSRIEKSGHLLDAYEKETKKSTELKYELSSALSKLSDLWHQEYKIVGKKLKNINESQESLKIVSSYKGDKESFLDHFKSVFKGSRVRESGLQKLVRKYSDYISIYHDMENALTELGGSTESFEQYFRNKLDELLTWQVPNAYVIQYQGKELKHHSLGQRASALILFVLSQRDNDVIIIDQPEDDLDNQTIYNDVIKLVRQIKPQVQFIFATHNANFPVLGDAEQVLSCSYSDQRMFVQSGSIDSPEIQQEIVDIMEGGEEAFNKRKEIYKIWKPQS